MAVDEAKEVNYLDMEIPWQEKTLPYVTFSGILNVKNV